MIKRIIPKVIVFIIFAFASAFVVNKLNNSGINKVSREMADASLPTIYFSIDGEMSNPTYGYRRVMSTSLMRDSVVPINDEKKVTVLVPEDEEGTVYTYELRNIDGDNLIERGDVSYSGSTSDGYEKLEIAFRMDMEVNQEYVLVVVAENSDSNVDAASNTDLSVAKNDSDKIRYYTRVSYLESNHALDMMTYAQEFHNLTFTKTANEENGNMVYDLLKTTKEGSNDDLSHVSLESSYEMVSWGGMNIISITGIVPTLVEVDDEFALVKFSYIAESYKSGADHYFYINEYYSMKYDVNANEVQLLSFDRYQNSFFDESYINRSRNTICMGISLEDGATYETDSDNSFIAFTKAGELWSYNYDTADLVNVFSFIQNDYTNQSLCKTDFDITIDKVNDDGDIWFTVYGYNVRGDHDGENGISLYHFSITDNRIEELTFVACDEPFDVMKEEVGRFNYFDGEDNYYFLLDGAIHHITLSSKSDEELVNGIPSGSFIVSDNKKIVAYPTNADEQDNTEVIIHNFETGNEYKESGTATERLLAIGFIGNDVIYGKADANDVVISNDGKVTFPLKSLYIMKPTGDIVKDYSKPGIYIMDATVSGEKIYLKRAEKMTNFFTEVDPDIISYKSDNNSNLITKSYNFDEEEYNQLEIALPDNMFLTDASIPVMTKSKECSGYAEFSVNTTVDPEKYYVFGNLGYKGEYNTAGRAIEAVVDEGDGLVIDYMGNSVYRNQDATEYNTVASSVKETACTVKEQSLMTCAYMCIEMLDNRVTYEDVMQYSDFVTPFAELTTGTGLNVSGIELSTALYFLDRDIPFVTEIDEDYYVLVISYNSTHIRYYDPVKGEEEKLTREEFETLMANESNTIYTYSK